MGAVSAPLVSCLMVTHDRPDLARRAVRCYARQDWENKELVVVDDGKASYADMLAEYEDRVKIRYHRFPPDPERLLGAIRNLSLELAEGEFCAQWDDDEWYHPTRISAQMEVIADGYDGSVLKQTLMHLDTKEFVDHPYRTGLWRGTPGTILHRASGVRYPNLRRNEDTRYLERIRKKLRIKVLTPSHLFIRCFHGRNTWGREHFTNRLRRNPSNFWSYLVARFIRRDLFTHPAFQLTDDERVSIKEFRKASRELNVLQSLVASK